MIKDGMHIFALVALFSTCIIMRCYNDRNYDSHVDNKSDIVKTNSVDFAKNIEEFGDSCTYVEDDVLWTTRTMTLRFEDRTIEVNTGLRSDGVFVWKRCTTTGFEY